MGHLYGRAGRLTAENGGFRPGQMNQLLAMGSGRALKQVRRPPTPPLLIAPAPRGDTIICHSTLSLAATECHSSRIYTL
jgi:hypothetical protein